MLWGVEEALSQVAMKLGTPDNMNKTTALKAQDSTRIIFPCTKIKSCLAKQDLRGQSVAVLGLGKSGISAARLALARGASVIAIDQNENLGPVEATEMQDSNGFELLVEPLNHHRGVITFGSSGMMIEKTLAANGLSIPCLRAQKLMDAVGLARHMAKSGDAIVLSPGCASFDEFRNLSTEGKSFRSLLSHLNHSSSTPTSSNYVDSIR